LVPLSYLHCFYCIEHIMGVSENGVYPTCQFYWGVPIFKQTISPTTTSTEPNCLARKKCDKGRENHIWRYLLKERNSRKSLQPVIVENSNSAGSFATWPFVVLPGSYALQETASRKKNDYIVRYVASAGNEFWVMYLCQDQLDSTWSFGHSHWSFWEPMKPVGRLRPPVSSGDPNPGRKAGVPTWPDQGNVNWPATRFINIINTKKSDQIGFINFQLPFLDSLWLCPKLGDILQINHAELCDFKHLQTHIHHLFSRSLGIPWIWDFGYPKWTPTGRTVAAGKLRSMARAILSAPRAWPETSVGTCCFTKHVISMSSLYSLV
jgi:hypothetical protein